MNAPIHENEYNRVLLKPRFEIDVKQGIEPLLELFEAEKKKADQKFEIKVVGNHVVVDWPEEESHFWSPQLHLEVLRTGHGSSKIKALLGPRPKIWTFFMFLHFAVAIAFIVFFVMLYVRWSLDQDFTTALTMCLVTPVLSFGLYFSGQLGKKIGYDQMKELHDYLENLLEQE